MPLLPRRLLKFTYPLCHFQRPASTSPKTQSIHRGIIGHILHPCHMLLGALFYHDLPHMNTIDQRPYSLTHAFEAPDKIAPLGSLKYRHTNATFTHLLGTLKDACMNSQIVCTGRSLSASVTFRPSRLAGVLCGPRKQKMRFLLDQP